MQEAVEKIMALLENHLSDPLSRNKKWIYDDIPRLDLSSYPRIGIVASTSDISSFGVSEIGKWRDIKIHVYVFIKKKQKIGTRRDLEILNDLAENIKLLIRTYQSDLTDDKIKLITPISDQLIELKDHYIRDIQLKVYEVR